MAKSKTRIQYLLNEYIEKYGSIDLLLPDGVGVEIGITQEEKHGLRKQADYCWVVTKRDSRSTVFDRYIMSMEYGEDRYVVDNSDDGSVTIV